MRIKYEVRIALLILKLNFVDLRGKEKKTEQTKQWNHIPFCMLKLKLMLCAVSNSFYFSFSILCVCILK